MLAVFLKTLRPGAVIFTVSFNVSTPPLGTVPNEHTRVPV